MNRPAAVFVSLIGLLGWNCTPAFQPVVQNGNPNARVAAELSSDCTAKSTPQGFSRIFIASDAGSHHRGNQKSLGSTANNPYDGSTAEKFDTILRSKSEANQQNLIVCIGPGTFKTEGTYDFVINVPHKTARGFTVNRGWKVHGAGADKTILKLISFFPDPAKHTGVGMVLSTHDDGASGIEISDLGIDDNYPELKPAATQQGIKQLNLEAIHLRADQGGHWIHRVNVVHSSGEGNEVFPVWIASVNNKSSSLNSGNIIEYVTMSGWGGGQCTAIAIANALGEVRNNSVDGYQIGYGGWILGKVWFHDNVTTNTAYGFNIDSLDNDGVRITNNRIIHPQQYGIVVGGGGRYANFQISDNTIEINNASVRAIFLHGNVTNALIERNKFIADSPLRNLNTVVSRGSGNTGNIERSNQVIKQ